MVTVRVQGVKQGPYYYLGIIRSSSCTTTARTSRQISQQGSLSLHSLEPAPDLDAFTPSPQCTCSYSSIYLPHMVYGCELWAVTKTEMKMLERSHRIILCTIQGLPLHGPNSGLLAVTGALSIADLITTRKLLFVHSIVSLPEHSLPCQVLLERLQAPNAKAWLPSNLASSDSLNSPFCQ